MGYTLTSYYIWDSALGLSNIFRKFPKVFTNPPINICYSPAGRLDLPQVDLCLILHFFARVGSMSEQLGHKHE